MKIFLDTAMVDEIKEAASWGILDGVTTNPSHAMKANRKFETVIREISTLVGPRGTVSAETVSLDAEGMVRDLGRGAGRRDRLGGASREWGHGAGGERGVQS